MLSYDRVLHVVIIRLASKVLVELCDEYRHLRDQYRARRGNCRDPQKKCCGRRVGITFS